MKNNGLAIEIAKNVSDYARKKVELIKDCADFAWDKFDIGNKIDETFDIATIPLFVTSLALSVALTGFMVKDHFSQPKEPSSWSPSPTFVESPQIQTQRKMDQIGNQVLALENQYQLSPGKNGALEPKRRLSKTEKRKFNKELREIEREANSLYPKLAQPNNKQIADAFVKNM